MDFPHMDFPHMVFLVLDADVHGLQAGRLTAIHTPKTYGWYRIFFGF